MPWARHCTAWACRVPVVGQVMVLGYVATVGRSAIRYAMALRWRTGFSLSSLQLYHSIITSALTDVNAAAQ